MFRIDASNSLPRVGAVPATTAPRAPGGELLQPHMAPLAGLVAAATVPALPVAARPGASPQGQGQGQGQGQDGAAAHGAPEAEPDTGVLRAMQPPVLLPGGLRAMAQVALPARAAALSVRPNGGGAETMPLESLWRTQVLSASMNPEAANGLPGERPLYLLQPWFGVSAALWLVDPEPDDAAPAAVPDGQPCALRVQLQLPTLGCITLHLQQSGGGSGRAGPPGLLLALAVALPGAIPWLRQALPALAAACSRSGLRLLRCRLEAGQGVSAPFLRAPLRRRAPPERLSAPLFQALAELLTVLEAADRAAASAVGARSAE